MYLSFYHVRIEVSSKCEMQQRVNKIHFFQLFSASNEARWMPKSGRRCYGLKKKLEAFVEIFFKLFLTHPLPLPRVPGSNLGAPLGLQVCEYYYKSPIPYH